MVLEGQLWSLKVSKTLAVVKVCPPSLPPCLSLVTAQQAGTIVSTHPDLTFSLQAMPTSCVAASTGSLTL
jgi:hypothetical protein